MSVYLVASRITVWSSCAEVGQLAGFHALGEIAKMARIMGKCNEVHVSNHYIIIALKEFPRQEKPQTITGGLPHRIV